MKEGLRRLVPDLQQLWREVCCEEEVGYTGVFVNAYLFLPAFFFLPFFGVLTEEDRLLVLVSRFDTSMRLET